LVAWTLTAPWREHPRSIPLQGIKAATLVQSIKDGAPPILTWMRFGRPDVLASVTFWGGFGWLEKLLPEGIVSVLAGASGLAFAGLLAWIGRRRSGRALVWVACATAGYALSAAAYAFASRLSFGDVHGRYLIGLYLFALVVAWSVVARWSGERRIGQSGLVTCVAAASVLALHAWTLTYLLGRYFF